MTSPNGFPSRLLRLRAEAGLTQKELAQISGVSLPQIARYERGASTPRMTALVKLAKALDVEVSDLQDAKGEPETYDLRVDFAGEELSMAIPAEQVDKLREIAKRLGWEEIGYQVALISLGMRQHDGPMTDERIEEFYRMAVDAGEWNARHSDKK